MEKILQYKAKPHRDYPFRWGEFERYQKYLQGLARTTPAVHFPKAVVQSDVRALKGKTLKSYEDMLDAAFCAYIAYYAWAHPEKCRVLGSMKEGYIMTPVFAHMYEQTKLAKR